MPELLQMACDEAIRFLNGLAGLPKPAVLSGSPHSCIFKCLAMLGMGRASMQLLPTLPDREAFLTPTIYKNTPGMRAAFSNWRTTPGDVEIAWRAMLEAAIG